MLFLENGRIKLISPRTPRWVQQGTGAVHLRRGHQTVETGCADGDSSTARPADWLEFTEGTAGTRSITLIANTKTESDRMNNPE